MLRRKFLGVLGGAAVASSLPARAEQASGVRKIGVLFGYERNPIGRASIKSMEQSLEKLGWIDDRNVKIEVRWTGADPERIPRFARELVAWQPDVIVTSSTPTTAAAQRETQTIPIIFAWTSNPIEQGFVESLAHPGGNITGFVHFEGSMSSKWVSLLKEVDPRIVRAAGLFHPDAAPGGGSLFSRPFVAAAQALGITPMISPVRSDADIDAVISAMGREPNGSLIMMADSFMWAHRARFIEQAARHRVKAIYPYPEATAEGGLLSYSVDTSDISSQIASYVDRILRGAKPSELPVQVPTKFKLVINLRAAKMLDLNVPATLLATADEVIE